MTSYIGLGTGKGVTHKIRNDVINFIFVILGKFSENVGLRYFDEDNGIFNIAFVVRIGQKVFVEMIPSNEVISDTLVWWFPITTLFVPRTE